MCMTSSHLDVEAVADSLLSPQTVAAVLPETSTATVTRWCRDGRFPGARKLPSGRWIIPTAWVLDLVTPPESVESGPSLPDGQASLFGTVS